ncbi:MAG: hypothetical protein IPL78_11150 [Chloroflexi bacterium]|nr:hypothetical protein [Chloroflexota bacterium]
MRTGLSFSTGDQWPHVMRLVNGDGLLSIGQHNGTAIRVKQGIWSPGMTLVDCT